MIELDWSEQSSHIRTLFHPWQPGDGYNEATLQAAEAQIGAHLPPLLRIFYRAWGKRPDLTNTDHFLLNPEELVMRAGTLIFWVENQAVFYWGVRQEVLEEADPPVVITESGLSGWRVESELHWKPSHAHLSSFLDDMAYRHAFAGGAIHGGWTRPGLPDLTADQIAWLEEDWSKAIVSPLTFGLMPDSPSEVCPPLYIRDGQALFPFGWCKLAAREAKAVDEIGKLFRITWAHRW